MRNFVSNFLITPYCLLLLLDAYKELYKKYDQILGKLVTMENQAEKWQV